MQEDIAALWKMESSLKDSKINNKCSLQNTSQSMTRVTHKYLNWWIFYSNKIAWANKTKKISRKIISRSKIICWRIIRAIKTHTMGQTSSNKSKLWFQEETSCIQHTRTLFRISLTTMRPASKRGSDSICMKRKPTQSTGAPSIQMARNLPKRSIRINSLITIFQNIIKLFPGGQIPKMWTNSLIMLGKVTNNSKLMQAIVCIDFQITVNLIWKTQIWTSISISQYAWGLKTRCLCQICHSLKGMTFKNSGKKTWILQKYTSRQCRSNLFLRLSWIRPGKKILNLWK